MDYVTRTPDTEIPIILDPTQEAFAKVLESHRTEIESVERKTFKYGATDRHQLDAYFPSSPGSSKPPILIFAYGGGFYSGDRLYSTPSDLVYKNLGAFFAKRGFLTVIPDYRLATAGAVYPQPSEDIRDALAFVADNQEIANAGDTNNIFLLAHSAGSTIVATLLLHEPSLLNASLKKRVKGVALMGGAYILSSGPPSAPPPVVEALYGPQIAEREPAALLKAASEETISSLPPLLIFWSEKEAEAILITNEEFVKLLKGRTGKDTEGKPAKDHNHISPHWALGTGEGEEWAEDIVQWFKQRL